MTVKFRDPISARACILVCISHLILCTRTYLCTKKMHGRFFDGRKVEAALYSGKQRFNRSGTRDDVDGDSDISEKKRLDDFAQWLMAEGD